MIYFVAASDGRIKVGYSENAQQRIKSISSYLSEPVEVLGIIDGEIALERAIQRELKDFLIKGEWFRDCVEVRSYVHSLIHDADKLAEVAAKSKRDSRVSNFIPDPPDPKALGRVLRLFWPDDALAQLCAFTAASESECREWLSGESRPPRIIRYALRGLLAGLLLAREEDVMPNFITDDPDDDWTPTFGGKDHRSSGSL